MSFEEDIGKAYEIAAQRPKPVMGPPVGTPPPGTVPCGRCRVFIPVGMIRYYETGVVTASDSLCANCAKLVPRHALIVCVGCRAVVARTAPETLKSGFKFEPRKTYHVRDCPNCNTLVKSSKVIEAELFYQSQKR